MSEKKSVTRRTALKTGLSITGGMLVADRLALAAALAGRPRTLLLDEPTVGQDPESLRLMLLALKRFINEGGVLLSATHDYHAARALGQVVWRMEQGRILEKGGLELVERYFRTDLEQGNG